MALLPLAALLASSAHGVGLERPHGPAASAAAAAAALPEVAVQDELLAALDFQAGADNEVLASQATRLMRKEQLKAPDEGAFIEMSSARPASLMMPKPKDLEEDVADVAEPEQRARLNCTKYYMIRGAETAQPRRMGFFSQEDIIDEDTDATHPRWVNANQEYLYFSSDLSEWRIGPNSSMNTAGVASLKVDGDHDCPHQASGWQVFKGGNWTNEFNITLTAHTEECPAKIRVAGEEHPPFNHHMGEYKMTLHDASGKPIFEKHEGGHMYLYYWKKLKEWRIGPSYSEADASIASESTTTKCPQMVDAWFVVQNGWKQSELLHVISAEQPTTKHAPSHATSHAPSTATSHAPSTSSQAMVHAASTSTTLKPTEPRRNEPILQSHMAPGQKPEGTVKKQDWLVKGEYGDIKCPTGSRSLTEKECEDAATQHDLSYAGESSSATSPSACIHTQRGTVTFNTNRKGEGSVAFQPFCRGLSATLSMSDDDDDEYDEDEDLDEGPEAEMVTKKGKSSVVIVIVSASVSVVFLVGWFFRHRWNKAQQGKDEAEERKTFSAEDDGVIVPSMGAKVRIRSSGVEGIIVEETGNLCYTVECTEGTEPCTVDAKDLEVLESVSGRRAGSQKATL